MAKTVVVTGGSKGIGREICLSFARQGYNVVVCYNKSESEANNVKKLAEACGVSAMIAYVDVADIKSVESLANTIKKTFGSVDVLVNCAGVASYKMLIDTSEEEKKSVLDINLLGTINICQVFVKNMLKSGGGKIVNISSMWGVIGGSCESVYSASKAGVIGFSKAIAKEYGLANINVNVVAPGAILCGMTEKLGKETLDGLKEQIPLGKLGEASDVASVVCFLASDDAKYITGQVICVDGGMAI